ncbi:APC membrane recruitment protein 2 [Bagarius yarrelli]|uniref:APC membrane recruitment protein 2 n=1 Tax=Bagarius yarrelli TaxID=175774 RepID=A0A556VC94_BAGYA|nr:APC membrane recruitment protein 2 [Bagarius yarrelli]
MDAQSDSDPPPCNPQPPGKIRKALKLFSKRKPGGVARIFSVNVKGEGGLKSPPSRSQTLDGLTDIAASDAAAKSVELDQEDSHKDFAAMDDPTSIKEHNLESSSTRQSICSLTSAKSLSFLSMLRWNRKGGGEKTDTQTESQRSGQQKKGLKSLFGSVHWHRRDREDEDKASTDPPRLASRSNSVEIIRENLTLTSRSEHHFTDESEIEQLSPSQNDYVPPEDTKVSGAAKPSTNDRLSMLLGDTSSIVSLDTLGGGGDIVADIEAEWVKVSSHVEVKAITADSVKNEKDLLGHKPAPFISSSSTLPSSTSKLISLSTSPKTMPSPATKQTLPPPSSPSPTTSTQPILSYISSPTLSHAKEPLASPVQSQDSFLILSSNIIPDHITIPESHSTTPTLTIPAKPTLTPTSPLTPEPSPNPSPTILPPSFLANISKPFIPVTEKHLEPAAAAYATITEPNYAPSQTTSSNVACTPITRPNYSISQDIKHSSASVTKYPPFITSTKPVPTAPVIRPKIVTTFGLSTSRNTAPIIKPEPKQSTHQNKSGPLQIEKNGSRSLISNQQTLSSTTKNPPHKAESAHPLLPSEYSQLPSLSTKPGEKEQEGVVSARVVEGFQHAFMPEKTTQITKPTNLSRIPVSGGGKLKQHQKDVQSNGEGRMSNLPSPTIHEEEASISPSQECSSKGALSDLSTESGAQSSNEDMLDSVAQPTTGTVSTQRESKIPIKTWFYCNLSLFARKTRGSTLQDSCL